ncbi:mpv17-like protein isoform X1 [Prunus yedoensis var. nudiflora]|uniref:Mpv17-like protein isoform X1 n=1 Tax=Prunus yedoensis var. nudiflora TaxID=2094558 RepID=A0A314YIT0_PRUYE|nr:mpv17-like protein isoform X1 [Prunus yedoensis var. nudiflora]
MATLNIIAAHKLPSPASSSFAAQSQKPNFLSLFCTQTLSKPDPSRLLGFSTRKKRNSTVGSVTEDREVVPLKEKHAEDQDSSLLVNGSEEFEAVSSSSAYSEGRGEGDDLEKLTSRAINALIVLGFGTFAVSKLLTIDHDYWHGWTLYEILRYVPEHNWIAYEQALKANPVLAKMMISGVVYTLGDWIAQCYEGKPLLEFDRKRMFRSGLVGFTFHGSLSHYYYQFCEALFPLEDWWVVPAKIAFDQTVWAAIWNSIYFVVLGFLRLESPTKIFDELKATFWPMLTAGWKLWPFAHLVTYGLIPVEQRLLWVDCVELIWVTILSTYSNEKSESSISEAPSGADSASSSSNSPKEITQRAPDLKYLLHLDPGTPFRSKTTCNWASNNNGESGRGAPRVKWQQHREAEKEEEPWLNRVLRLRGLRFPLDLLCVPLLHHLQDYTRHHIRFLFTLETDILFNQVQVQA